MAITLVDMMPRQMVWAMLKQALAARPASPLHSCAPSESGAQQPTKQAVHDVHLVFVSKKRKSKTREQPSDHVVESRYELDTENSLQINVDISSQQVSRALSLSFKIAT